MKKIGLPSGDVTLISDEDLERVAEWAWRKKTVRPGVNYVEMANKKSKPGIPLHRFIMNPPDGLLVDHKDGDGMNNQRENLRICTNADNVRNRKLHSNSTTGYKGVWFYNSHKKYSASIMSHGNKYFLGLYDDPIEAARAYDKKARELHGEFARPNFK